MPTAAESRFLDELRLVLGPSALVEDPDVLVGYRQDQAGLVTAGDPLAAALPGSTREVAHVVQAAARHGVPVVPRGAGSGLSGGANAVAGCVVLSLARLDAILAIDEDELTATVQPGVLNATLSRRVRELGLWYPPDPASWEFSTLGGNLATNAGGLCCVKYGVTRDSVLALEVVLADGSVARVGRRTVKGVAGYDLVSLFVGSEGTLGIVTEALLRLRPSPQPPSTLVASFPALAAVGTAITATTRKASPSLLEVIDRTTIGAIERYKRMDLDTDAAAILIAQSDLPGEYGAAEVGTIERICTDAGADMVVVTADADETELLLAARRLAYPALEQLGTTLLDDVAVPRSRITDMLGAIERVATEHELVIGTFGHAGDGNLHPTIVFDAADPDQVRAARSVFDAIVAAALELGGTVTGEHGVGTLKSSYLAAELGPAGMRLHRAIKHALDPGGVLNPGKVLPAEPGPGGGSVRVLGAGPAP